MVDTHCVVHGWMQAFASMVNAMRHRFATVDTLDLHWAELGEPGERTPVVLIHGIGDSHLTWSNVAEQFARDRLVLMPDLPGCGLSGRPDASYKLEWHARTIASWLSALDDHLTIRVGAETPDVPGRS